MRVLKKLVCYGLITALTVGNITPLYAQTSEKNDKQGEMFVFSGDDIKVKYKARSTLSSEQIILKYLEEQSSKFNINKYGNVTFKVISKEPDTLNQNDIVRLQQYINNIPIYGADIVSCIGKDGTIKSISGYIEPTDLSLEKFNFKPSIDVKTIINKYKLQEDKSLNSEMGIYLENEEYKLVYKLESNTEKLIVDAKSGNLITKSSKTLGMIKMIPNVEARGILGDKKKLSVAKEVNVNTMYYLKNLDKNIEVYNGKGKEIKPETSGVELGNIINNAMKNTYSKRSAAFIAEADGKFVDAYDYTVKSYDFYNNKFNRKGPTGKNNKVSVIANLNIGTNVGSYYDSYNNDSKEKVSVLVFGNKTQKYKDGSAAIDVVGHEYTHAVVNETAELDIEKEQSRAINEAYADIFGTLIEFEYSTRIKDWTMGEDISLNGGYTRNLKSPKISHVSKLNSDHGAYDYSGIISRVAYLISEGETVNGTKIKGIGKSEMGNLFYNTLTKKLTSNSDFSHFGKSLLDTAKTEHKDTVRKALESVGIIDLRITPNNDITTSTTEISGKTTPGATLEVKVNSKTIKKVTADKDGKYNVKIGNQKQGTKIEIITTKKYCITNKLTKYVKGLMNKLTINKVYFDSTSISGSTISGATVKAYVSGKQIGNDATSDKNGNYKITIPKQKVGTKIELKASKKDYVTKSTTTTVLKKSISKLTINKVYFDSTSISGSTMSGVTVKAYVGRKQIGKTVTSDKNGNYKITIPKQSIGTIIEVKASKTNYNTKLITTRVLQRQITTNLYPFINNGKVGYMDSTGNVIIKPKFNAMYNEHDNLLEAGEFVDGIAPVYTSDERVRYINTKGEYITSKVYDWGLEFSEGLALVSDNGSLKYIDKTGKTIINIKNEYEMVSPFSEGLAVYYSNGKYGYINKKGEVVIKPQYEDAKNFTNGYALVTLNGESAIIDKKGNNKTKNIYVHDEIQYYSWYQPVVTNGLFVRYGEGGYVFADINNPNNIKIYIKKTNEGYMGYDGLGMFSEGLAQFVLNDKVGYLDTNGKIVIPAKFEGATGFNYGLAIASYNDQLIIIDKKGNTKFKIPQDKYWSAIEIKSKNLISIQSLNGYEYYNENGKKINPKI